MVSILTGLRGCEYETGDKVSAGYWKVDGVMSLFNVSTSFYSINVILVYI